MKASHADLGSSVLFTCARLSEALENFFEWDRTHYSMFHRPTFRSAVTMPGLLRDPEKTSRAECEAGSSPYGLCSVNGVPAYLLCAMLAIGMYFASDDAHDMAEQIHDFNSKRIMNVSSAFQSVDMLPACSLMRSTNCGRSRSFGECVFDDCS